MVKKSDRGSLSYAKSMEFVNVKLHASDREKFRAWVRSCTLELEDVFLELTREGYKLSITLDLDNNCYIVSLIGTEKTENPSRCMSSRSESVSEGVYMSYYKHTIMFNSGVWLPEISTLSWG